MFQILKGMMMMMVVMMMTEQFFKWHKYLEKKGMCSEADAIISALSAGHLSVPSS